MITADLKSELADAMSMSDEQMDEEEIDELDDEIEATVFSLAITSSRLLSILWILMTDLLQCLTGKRTNHLFLDLVCRV